jgi:hypothetical protein
MGVRETESEGAAVEVQQRAPGAALGHADPLGGHAVALHGLATHGGVDGEVAGIQHLVAPAQRRQVGLLRQRALRHQAQQRVQRPAAPAAPPLDDPHARPAAVHRSRPCSLPRTAALHHLHINQRPLRAGAGRVAAPARIAQPGAGRVVAVFILEHAVEHQDLLATGVRVHVKTRIRRPAHQRRADAVVFMQRHHAQARHQPGPPRGG